MVFCNTLSNSKLTTFDQCKLKYKKQYVERADPDPDQDMNALRFGSFIHRILEDGYEKNSVSELQVIAEGVRSEYPFNPKKYSEKKIEKCLINFLRFNAGLSKTVGVELRYQAEIGPDMTVNGIIDRVVQGTAGGYLVIDYKTSKREKSQFDLYSDTQMMGYAYAIAKQYNALPENIVCAHYYPVTDNFVTIQYSRAQINNYQRMMVDKMWKIRKLKKDQLCPQKNEYCNWCQFKNQCPLFSK